MSTETTIQLAYSDSSTVVSKSLTLGESVFLTDTKEMLIGDSIGKNYIGKMLSGLEANLPTARYDGRTYYCTDTKNLYRDNGSVWVLINFQYFNQTSDDTESNTTSNSYIDKIDWTPNSIPSGSYMLFWSAESGNRLSSKHSFVRIYNNTDAITLAECAVSEYDVDNEEWSILSGQYYFSSLSGSINLKLQFKRDGGTAYVRRCRMALQRVA